MVRAPVALSLPVVAVEQSEPAKASSELVRVPEPEVAELERLETATGFPAHSVVVGSLGPVTAQVEIPEPG